MFLLGECFHQHYRLDYDFCTALMLTPPWKLVSLNLFGRRGSDAPPPQLKYVLKRCCALLIMFGGDARLFLLAQDKHFQRSRRRECLDAR